MIQSRTWEILRIHLRPNLPNFKGCITCVRMESKIDPILKIRVHGISKFTKKVHGKNQIFIIDQMGFLGHWQLHMHQFWQPCVILWNKEASIDCSLLSSLSETESGLVISDVDAEGSKTMGCPSQISPFLLLGYLKSGDPVLLSVERSWSPSLLLSFSPYNILFKNLLWILLLWGFLNF